MVTEIAPITFGYSHTIGRQENRSGSGFFYPVAITRDQENRLYVVSRGSETPAFFPCKRVTVFTVDEELVREFGTKVPPEEADDSAPDGSFMWPTSIALDKEGIAYVSDEWLNRISVFDKDGNCTGKWGSLGDQEGEIDRPAGLAFGAEDIESAALSDAFGEFDVGTAAGHVGCDGDGTAFSCVCDDGCFAFVVFCVEHLEVFDATFFEEVGE